MDERTTSVTDIVNEDASTATPSPVEVADTYDYDLAAPELYLNRELTWLRFNERVLHEAADPRTPLLERLKFLAIVDSNLDEFFMKRIGGLKQQVAAEVHDTTIDGRTPQEQIAACYDLVRPQRLTMQALLLELVDRLADEGIELTTCAQLSAEDRADVRSMYSRNIFPLVTPQAMDPAHPFPFISNLSLNLLVQLRHKPSDITPSFARVKVPIGTGISRLLRVGKRHLYVPLEDVMADNLDLLFPGMHVDSCEVFRVTRNANTERDEEEADDLMALIETELRDRKFAPIVRLEVIAGMVPLHRGHLAAELGLDEASDVFEVEGMLGLRHLMEIAFLDFPALRDAPHHPIDHPDLLMDRNIFHVIRDHGNVLLHHPYMSFSTSVERFLREAAVDPKVRAIKMTLYRTAADSRVIRHLITAAQNGKQVAVVVELKARFDEQANIGWAAHLESVGIHVTYGVVGLKTHCKTILVVRQDYSGLRRYAHVGTGNYHSGTARLYSDLGLLTCDDDIGHDLTELFNYLTTGYKPNRKYRKLLPAPKHLKPAILDKIRREIRHHEAGRGGVIQVKMNAIEDPDVTRALYEAAHAGVQVDLIVRDTCRIRPGLPGLSDTVRGVSIVGRFLEHARIIYFRNGGEEEYFIGSADLMKRNLESRVESTVPVESPHLQAELRTLLDRQLQDERSCWEMQSDGTYVQRSGSGRSCQEATIAATKRRHKEATRLRRRRTKGIRRRSMD